MTSPRSEPRSAPARWLAWCLVAVLLVLSPARAAASPAAASGPTTAEAEHRYVVPADQPRAQGKIELPLPPASFNTVDRGWIRFSYPPSTRERVEPLIREADQVKEELAERLGQRVLRNVHVRIARTPGEMTTLAPEGAPYPRYASGVAYSGIGLVLLTLLPERASALHDVSEVFRHELAHVALDDAIGDGHRVPYWFNEGLAVHLSGESSLLRLKTLSTATLSGRLIPLTRLERGFPSNGDEAEVAYAEAADVVRFLLRKEDSERFPALVRRVRDGESFTAALRDAYGLEPSSLEYEWREEVAKRYSFWPVFFSGGLIWVGVLLLFVLGWRRKNQRSKNTLERWAREEAYAELRRAQSTSAPPAARVHIVLPGRDAQEPPELPLGPPMEPPEVPRVQHEGQWHTLH